MSDADYLIERAQQELRAAMSAFDERVREVHLELADAYSFRLREIMRMERRAALSARSQSDPEISKSAFSWRVTELTTSGWWDDRGRAQRRD